MTQIPLLFSRYRYLALILAIVIVANAASFIYFFSLAAGNPDPYPVVAGDSRNYAALADALIEYKTFAYGGEEPERHWPIGYPLFLAATKAISGGFLLAIVLQVFLSLVAVSLMYLAARRFMPEPWALVPPLVFGLDPNVVLSNTIVISDGLFASLLMIAVFLVLFARMQELLRFALCGLLVGLLTVIRPIAQFLVAFAALLPILGIIRAPLWSDTRTYVTQSLACLFCGLLVVTPVLLWNYQKFGALEVSHVGASNLLYYNARDFLAWKEMNTEGNVPAVLSSRFRDNPAYSRVDAYIRAELSKLVPEEGDIRNYEGSLAARIILDDPLSYTYFHLVNTVPFFLGSSLAAYTQSVQQVGSESGFFAPTSLILSEAFTALRSGGFLAGLKAAAPILPILLEVLFWAAITLLSVLAVWKKRADTRVIILALLILYFAVLTGPVSIARYRIPVQPYLLILATIGTYGIVRGWQKKLTS